MTQFNLSVSEQELDFTLTNTDGKGQTQTVKAKSHHHTFAPVPAGEKNYLVSWTYKPPDGEPVSGETYRVWPPLLKLKVEMQPGAKGKVDGFTFKLRQAGESSHTAPSGDWSGQLQKSDYTFEAVSPWKIEATVASATHAAEYTLKVSQLPWTAKIISHDAAKGRAEATPWKQYVNLDAGADADKGHKISVEVAPSDRALGLKDQKISVCVTFDAKNSERDTPRPALWVGGLVQTSEDPSAKPGKAALVYKAPLSLPSNGGSCVFEVELGYAGGDGCHIQVGFDDGMGDDELWVRNWRRLESEFIVPHSTLRQGWATLVNNDDAAPAPHHTFEAAIKKILDPLFIELVFPPAFRKVYTEGDINALLSARGGAATFVVQGSSVSPKLDAHKKCTFLSPADLDALRDRVLPLTPADPRRLMLIWTDMMPKTLSDDDTTVEQLEPGEYYFAFEPAQAGAQPMKAKDDLFVALRYPLCTGPDNQWGIEKILWKISGWRRQGETDWKGLAEIYDYKNPVLELQVHNELWEYQEVVPANLPEVEGWVEFTNFKDFKVKLSAGGANPRALLTVGPFEHQITVTYKMRHFRQGANANAIQGKIRMTPTSGLGTAPGVARTLCHELGHNLGHAYFENKAAATDKRGRAARHKIPGLEFELHLPDGAFYSARGHKGAHCAHGLIQAGKDITAKTFVKSEFMLDTNCVLFGAGNQLSAVEFKYCEKCLTYIKASDALDITKNWKA